MKAAWTYTVLPGDTMLNIVSAIRAVAGVQVGQITEVNSGLEPTNLQVGQIIHVPSPEDIKLQPLNYTIRVGDTLGAVADSLSLCKTLTLEVLESHNPEIDPERIKPGQLLIIPLNQDSESSSVKMKSVVDIKCRGFWDWTYSHGLPPADSTISMAFSGWADIKTALQQSHHKLTTMVGEKYLCLGGGNASGAMTTQVLNALAHAISQGLLSDYDGIAYDVEEGESGLSEPFRASFSTAQAHGLKVLVTISHSAPYGIKDAKALMMSFFNDANIDYLSPQLYTTGKESQNDYATSHGVDWSLYADCQAEIVPSIVNADMYEDAKRYFAEQGVILSGYVQWQQLG